MSQINLKSITGITSITTPAGVDNQLTVHNYNTTEAVKLDNAGNVHINNQLAVTGVTTFTDDVYFDGATADRDIIFDRSANTLQVKRNAILKIGQGSYSTDLYSDGTNTIFDHNTIGALFVKSNIFQVYGTGTSGGNTYDGTIFRCMNGKTELGYEVPNGGATTLDNLVTTPIGVTVGTGVTIERNGQATFTGIVTATSFVGNGAQLTGIVGGKFGGGATGIQTVGNVGIQTANMTAPDLVGAASSMVGLYIGDGHLLFSNYLNKSGGYYITTGLNALNAGPVTLGSTMTLDGTWVIV